MLHIIDDVRPVFSPEQTTFAAQQTDFCGTADRLLRNSRPTFAAQQTDFCGTADRLFHLNKPLLRHSRPTFAAQQTDFFT